MINKKINSKLFIIMLTALPVMNSKIAQSQENPTNEIVNYSISNPGQVQNGKLFRLDVLFMVSPGWYVYAPTGVNSAQGMIETTIIFKLPAGITRAGGIKLPKPVRKYGHEIYEGNKNIMSQALKVSPTLKPGNYEIRCKVIYQTCNSRICLPPKTDEISVTVEVKENIVAVIDSDSQSMAGVERVFSKQTNQNKQ